MKKLIKALRGPQLNSIAVRRAALALAVVLLGSVFFTGYRMASDICAVLDTVIYSLPLPG